MYAQSPPFPPPRSFKQMLSNRPPLPSPRSLAGSYFESVQQARLLDELVEQAFLLHQRGGAVEFGHGAVIQHHDAVRVQDGVDAVRDRDDGAILEHATPQRGLQQRVRLDVDGGLEFWHRTSRQSVSGSHDGGHEEGRGGCPGCTVDRFRS